MLLGHRYYDSSTGRFLTKDPIKSGRNWYAYCRNNPTRGTDPSGLYGEETYGDYFGAMLGGIGEGIWKGTIGGIIDLGKGIISGDIFDFYLIDKSRNAMALSLAKAWDGDANAFGNLWGQGAVTIATTAFAIKVPFRAPSVGAGGLSADILEGVYIGTHKETGLVYVGQTSNILKRPWAGHLDPTHPIDFIPVRGGKLARELVEQDVIDSFGGVGSDDLANIRNPIGAKRKHLRN